MDEPAPSPTQQPDAGAPPAPAPPQNQCSCNITSQTASTTLPNRSRTKIGVGEMVTLTCSTGAATWTTTAGGTLSSTTGSSVRFTAGDAAATPTITATTSGCSCTITLDVVTPSGYTMIAIPSNASPQVRHDVQGRPDCGFKAAMFLLPVDVSFHALEVRELNDPFTATGFYAPFNGKGHRPSGQPSAAAAVLQPKPPLGSRANLVDEVYSGDPGGPVKVGKEEAPARFEFRLAVGPGPWQSFPGSTQVASVTAAGDCTVTKAGAKATTHMNDQPSSW
ncbi:MAG: hypothetical protein QM820_49570 [Minicystis sp.]